MRLDPPPPAEPDLPAPLRRALEAALQAPPQRVQRVAAGGRALWLKRAERLSLRWRLQKGDTRRAFEADRAGLHDLAALGLPVARVVAEGPDFFATAEAGWQMADLLRDAQGAGPGRVAACRAAGAALAALHRAGVAHGRPSIRDICWDGQAARFIDLERYRKGPAGPGAMALDVLILLHSMFAITRGPAPEIAAALEGWREGAPEGAWPAVRARAARLGWLGALARLALRLRPRSKELAAVALVLDFVAAQGRGAAAASAA